MSTTYDAIVIGAGAMGSAAAYYFAKEGQKTLLLEQFELDHKMGSSGDHSRIIRYAYDHPTYIELAHSAYALWRALEEASGETLYIKTGGLDFGTWHNQRFIATRQAMLDMGIHFEQLSALDVHEMFPQFHLTDNMGALFQPDAGILRASACVVAHAKLAQRHGAVFLEHCIVQKIAPSRQGVTIETTQGAFSAGRLAICMGAWAKTLLAPLGLDLPLQPTREQVVYFNPDPIEDYTAPNIPIYICWGDEGDDIFYGMGSVRGSGFKAAQHLSYVLTTPETINRTPDASYIEKVRGFLKRHIPRAADAPLVEAKVCMYTMTPDEHFIIDRHPAYPHIAFGAGFSGHGFKFSTLIGKIVADLASQKPIDHDLSLFRADRFARQGH